MTVKIFDELIGKTLTDIQVYKNEKYREHRITFIVSDEEQYLMHHRQDCCEIVEIDDICGDLKDLIGSPIMIAEEVSSENEDPKDLISEERIKELNDGYRDSYTWTFYKFATNKGYVTIRWYGESNGYYSESVYFDRM